jgi:hypothetical protein
MEGNAKNKNRKLIQWAKPSFWGKEREYVIEALDSSENQRPRLMTCRIASLLILSASSD